MKTIDEYKVELMRLYQRWNQMEDDDPDIHWVEEDIDHLTAKIEWLQNPDT